MMEMQEIKDKIHELIHSAYEMGYEDGKNLEYDLGLNDAWECARKIMLSDEDGGIALSDILKIFGMTQYSAIKKFSASEAIDKLKEYEEKQAEVTCESCGRSNTFDTLKTYCVNCDGSCWIPKTQSACESCKFKKKEQNEEPCKSCSHNYVDKYRTGGTSINDKRRS